MLFEIIVVGDGLLKRNIGDAERIIKDIGWHVEYFFFQRKAEVKMFFGCGHGILFNFCGIDLAAIVVLVSILEVLVFWELFLVNLD